MNSTDPTRIALLQVNVAEFVAGISDEHRPEEVLNVLEVGPGPKIAV